MNNEEAAQLRDQNTQARAFNEQVIAEFRANKGIVGGHFKDAGLLLLHHVGRRTGKQYVLPVLYMHDGGSLVVAGSNGGAKREPAWVANLEAMPETTVEVGEQTLTVKVSVLRGRVPERERPRPGRSAPADRPRLRSCGSW